MIYSHHAQKISYYLLKAFERIETNIEKGLSSPKVYSQETDEAFKLIAEEFTRQEAEHKVKAPLLRQCWVIWNQAVLRRMPTIWCLRVNPTVDAVYELLCASAKVPPHCICNSFPYEKDLPRITNALTNLANAPLWVCANPDSGRFLEIMESMADENVPYLVVCDWQLEDGEQAAMNRLARVSSNLTFLCPP